MDKFWIVYNPGFFNSNIFQSKEKAVKHKEELQRANPGLTFTVMVSDDDKKYSK